MKKLLSILGSLSLIGTSAVSVVACSGTSGSDTDALLEEALTSTKSLSKLMIMSRHENLNLTEAGTNSFISHDSVNNALSNRGINLGDNHGFIKLDTLYSQWKNWFATASQDEFKDLGDFIQKDDPETIDQFYWLNGDSSNLNTGGINSLDSNLYTNSTTVNNGLSNMDTVLKLFDKNSLDSMVKLLSTFLPTTKTEGQGPYGSGNLNMIYKDYAMGIIVIGVQGMFLNAVYKAAANGEGKQQAIALYGQDLYNNKLFGNPDNNSIVDGDGNKALWNKSDTKKIGDDTGLFGQTVKNQIALVKPNLDPSTAHDDDFFGSDYAVWQDGVKKILKDSTTLLGIAMAAANAKPAQFDEFMHLTDNNPGIKAMEVGMQIKLHINLKFSDVNYKLFLSGINQFLTSLVNFEGDDTSWDALGNDSNYKWTTIDKLHHATLGRNETEAYDKFWASNNNTNYRDEVNQIMSYDPSGTSPTGFVKNSLYDVLYSWGHDNNGDMYNALYGPEGAFAKGLINFNKSADFVYDNLYGPWLDDNKYWTYENIKHQYDTTGKLAAVSFDIEYHGLGDLSTNLDAHKQAVDLDKLKNDEQYRASWNGTGLYFDPADPSKVLYGQVKNKYHVEWTNIGTSVLNDMMLTDMKWYQPNGVDYYYL